MQVLSTRDAGEQFSIGILEVLSVAGAFCGFSYKFLYEDLSSILYMNCSSSERMDENMKEALLSRTRQMTHEDMAAMGQRIKEARIAAGVKQVELARYFAIGRNEMYRIEAGTRPCKMEYLYEIALMFEVSVDYLMFG